MAAISTADITGALITPAMCAGEAAYDTLAVFPDVITSLSAVQTYAAVPGMGAFNEAVGTEGNGHLATERVEEGLVVDIHVTLFGNYYPIAES